MSLSSTSNSSPSVINEEAEKSFFALCQLDRLQIESQVIRHNLEKWAMTIFGSRIKSNQIQLEIVIPYDEMTLEVDEKIADTDFFHKNTARITISGKKSASDSYYYYFGTKTVTVSFSTQVEYVLFDTPYFYPHNWYNPLNKAYLYNKICYSVNFIRLFVDAYKKCFQSGVPLIHVKHARESREAYEIDIILKEYMTISYLKTDVNTATLYFHLLLETDKKKTNGDGVSKYSLRTITIPRDVRTGDVCFTFTANVV